MTIRQGICDLIHKKFGCKCSKDKLPELYGEPLYCELVEKLYLMVCGHGGNASDFSAKEG